MERDARGAVSSVMVGSGEMQDIWISGFLIGGSYEYIAGVQFVEEGKLSSRASGMICERARWSEDSGSYRDDVRRATVGSKGLVLCVWSGRWVRWGLPPPAFFGDVGWGIGDAPRRAL